ncbi:hypothetical protein SAMD00019534_097140 [Acytostelium subglobosum LB1]|uniref:hypothetical protein n=1 Tax=Acytostelium subglobosum LB1 TaxID=1410327 RepID=UPI000644D743|nr:hypothetical protein SAMD00019534_097140 [Acytostelium subglobosum LB1]GAM26539.1 hypothetical protein SAMD00019534_097140 [Acytostelium subglobosum LB1]|eukprot:XP_012750635.1 hypothetical protein SAMD00019534_097140 [Acytostelium subglobosum LB1]
MEIIDDIYSFAWMVFVPTQSPYQYQVQQQQQQSQQQINHHNYLHYNQSSSSSLAGSNSVWPLCIIALLLYIIYRRERLLSHYSSTIKEILHLSPPDLMFIEISFDNLHSIVKTFLAGGNGCSAVRGTSSDAEVASQTHIGTFCSQLGLDPVTLEQELLKSSLVSGQGGTVIVKTSCDKKFRFTGTFDSASRSFKGVVVDITQQELEIKRLKHSLTHDPLTGLQNRYQLTNKIQKFCSGVSDGAAVSALFFLDVDKFKLVNDTYGHESGDALLKNLSTRLQQYQCNDCMPIRLSGDEFLIVARNISSVESADSFIREYIQQLTATPYALGGNVNIQISISYGGVIFQKSDHECMDLIIKNADDKMYQMKRSRCESTTISYFVKDKQQLNPCCII